LTSGPTNNNYNDNVVEVGFIENATLGVDAEF